MDRDRGLERMVTAGLPVIVERSIYLKTEDFILTLFDCISAQRTLVKTLETLLPYLSNIHPSSPEGASQMLLTSAQDPATTDAVNSFITFRTDAQTYFDFLKRSTGFPFNIKGIPRGDEVYRALGDLVMLQGTDKHYAAFVGIPDSNSGLNGERETILHSVLRKGMLTMGQLRSKGEYRFGKPITVTIYSSPHERISSLEEAPALQISLNYMNLTPRNLTRFSNCTPAFLLPELEVSLVKLRYGDQIGTRNRDGMLIYSGITVPSKSVYVPRYTGLVFPDDLTQFNGEDPAAFEAWLECQPPENRALVRQYTTPLERLQTAAGNSLAILQAKEKEYRKIIESPDGGIEAIAAKELSTLLDF